MLAGPGFAALPSALQAHIVARHLQDHALDGPAVRGTCRSFYEHARLHSRARQVLNITSARAATLLPYLPHLTTVKCSEDALPFSRFVYKILASPRHPMPQLLSLSLHCHVRSDVPALLAAAAHNTQLTALSLGVHTVGEVEVQQPIPELPLLPSLRKLSLMQFCAWNDGDPYEQLPAIGLSCLGELCLLTSLHTGMELHPALEQIVPSESQWDAVDTTVAMQAVCTALGSLSELREVVLHGWTTSSRYPAEACWQSLAHSLPSLQHLTRLETIAMLQMEECINPACLLALAAKLPFLTSLRSLAISGFDCSSCYQERWCHVSREANGELVRAVAAKLPFLTSLRA